MIRYARRGSRLCSSLLLTGVVAVVWTAGCSSSSSSPTPDANPSKLDAPAGAPDLAKDLPASTGGVGGSADTALLATGGTMAMDATVDATPVRPDSGASDVGGTGGTPGMDVAPNRPESGALEVNGTGGAVAGDASVDAPIDGQVDGPGFKDGSGLDQSIVPIDGASQVPDAGGGEVGMGACKNPLKAWQYQGFGMNTIAWDNGGNLITGETFYPATTQFGPSPVETGVVAKEVTGNGSADILLAKLDPSSGNPLWVFTAGDALDQQITGVAASSAGVGAIGTFQGNLEIVTGSAVSNSSTLFVDFLAGLSDADGSGVWSKKVNLGGGKLVAIAGQPGKDYFIVCGSAMNAAANLNAVGTLGGGKDVLLAAVKASDGTILWSKLFGGAMDQECTAAALDDDGNAVFAGTYAGALDFGLGPLAPAPTGAQDAILWVAKVNGVSGATMAAASFGTAGIVTPYAVAADAQGKVLLAGSFRASVTFGSTTLNPASASSGDAFVAKLDASLVPIWARRWGSANAVAKGVATDSAGNVTVVGNYWGTLDVGPGSVVLTSARPTTLDTYIVTLDGGSGQTLCAHGYGDASSHGGGAFGISINRWATGTLKDSTAIVGGFTTLVDFGSPTAPLATASTSTPIPYLLRM